MKRGRVVGILCLVIVSLFTGCGNTQSSINEANDSNVENDVVEVEDNEKESQTVESVSPLEELAERDQVLSGYTIITPYIQIILTNNGKVLSRGENMYGQLGNGERTNSETWVEVEGLEDVVGIYSLGNVGDDMYDEHAYGHCYALTDSGELYRWGGNILTPEKVTLFSKIKEVESLNSSNLFIKCESGEKYIVIPRWNLNCDDSVYSYNSLPDNAQLSVCSSDEYLVYDNNQFTLADADGLHQYGGTDSFDQIHPIEDQIDKTIPIDVTEPIESIIPCSYDGFGGATLVTESGSVIGLTYDDGNVTTEDLGGQAIKKASINYTDFTLFRTGELCASGDNESGQLGDGTMTDYDDGFISIDESYFSDFEYNSPDEYCIALDMSYNIWGWGKGFGVTPEIIVENADFILE